jgi:L-amino acid N-acyltransferase YncA
MRARKAARTDAAAIAAIYNQGIEERVATFETRPRSRAEIEHWFDQGHPIVVVEEDGRVIAFAATFTYRLRDCYAGIAETSLYVDRQARGRGAGRLAMTALLQAAQDAGFWKLVSRIFPENSASLNLVESLGFRQVGTYAKHGRLDGVWRDVVIVERLIPANLGLEVEQSAVPSQEQISRPFRT